MTGYHDYVLGLIPAFVLGPIAASPLVGLSVQIAVAIGGAAAALVVAHALFVRGPVPQNRTVRQARVERAVDGTEPATVTTTEAGTVSAPETAPQPETNAMPADGPTMGPATGGD
jgi:predicted lipid-binding transport protein (Tim44 family)